MSVLPALALALQAVQEIAVVADDLVITQSCKLVPSGQPIVDDEGDGVVHIIGDGLVVEFTTATLMGAPAGAAPDAFCGVGVRVVGKNVTLRGARVAGFKTAIWATRADGLVIEGADVSGNYRQRLKSTDAAEHGDDWLWPHKNDQNEWALNYGAGIYVEESRNVVLRRNRARAGQNGIALRRVDESAIYDNDMSFLSGWGLALFRSSHNVVDHNSFDFCIRGYSHGRYARGQDSAGILCFEQCHANLFAYNSATHGGDGFFGFAGLEALEGDVRQPGIGCNHNQLWRNDFSYAAAIGIEMTFSFANVFAENRLVGSNYGIWGGYSSGTAVQANEIAENLLAGIAVEHGSDWTVLGNRFARNARAVELWWDDDQDLLAKPWAKHNPTASKGHAFVANRFDDDATQLELRGGTRGVRWDASQPGTARAAWRVDDASEVLEQASAPAVELRVEPRLEKLPGTRAAVGGRANLAGRDKIIVTEWGPYDWEMPLLHRGADRGTAHAWRLLGYDIAIGLDAGPHVIARLDASSMPPVIVLTPREPAVVPYELMVRVPSQTLVGRGVLCAAQWAVQFGAYSIDPRENVVRWREELARGVRCTLPRLSLAFGSGGPSELVEIPAEVAGARIGRERFGTLARANLRFPAGGFRLRVTSDDGVRVLLDGRAVIENWTHHGPTTDTAEVRFDVPGEHTLEVEHFELDGWAVLELDIESLAAAK